MRIVELPEEPKTDDPESLEVIFRMPLSGERIKRRFLQNDTIAALHDFIDDLQRQGKCQFEGVTNFTSRYQLIQNMPRKVYDDSGATLESLGFFPRGAMLQVQQTE